MCECGESLGVAHPATFTHWPASESHSLPQFILLYLLLPNPPPILSINLLLPFWCFSSRIKNARDFPFYPFSSPIRLHTCFSPSLFPTSSSGYCSLESFPQLCSCSKIFWLFFQVNLWQNIIPCIHPCIANLWHVTETWWTVVIKGQKSQSWPGEGKMEMENLKVTVIIESALMRLLWHFKALRATWKLAQWTTKSLSNKCLWTPSTVSSPYTTLWYAWFGWKVNHFNLWPQ